MRPVEPLEKSPVDVFRVDTKAAGEEIVIGGWETGQVPDQKTARWFSFRLNRRIAPWAYLIERRSLQEYCHTGTHWGACSCDGAGAGL